MCVASLVNSAVRTGFVLNRKCALPCHIFAVPLPIQQSCLTGCGGGWCDALSVAGYFGRNRAFPLISGHSQIFLPRILSTSSPTDILGLKIEHVCLEHTPPLSPLSIVHHAAHAANDSSS